MISPLKNGDIIISLHEEIPDNLEPHQIIKQLKKLADHGMVYKESPQNDARIYHAFEGKKLSGVGSHSLDQAINKSKSQLGALIVISCPDDELRQSFANIVERWDPKLLKEDSKKLPIKDDGKRQLPTAFTNFFQREKDAPHVKRQHELFRAFRAYDRNQEQDPIPLSKNKGVSCSNFIAYSFKAAIINKLFPDGLPQKIQLLLIEHSLLKTTHEPQIATKLKEIDQQFYIEFEATVKSILESNQIPNHLKDVYLAFLYSPVKGYSINDFCNHIKNFPELMSFKGIMFYQKEIDENSNIISKPYLMDYQNYQMLIENSANASKKHPTIEISKDALAQLEIYDETTQDVKSHPKI